MPEFESKGLIKTTIKKREEVYYLVSEDNLNDFKSKDILADIFLSLAFLCWGGYISIIIAKATDYKIFFLILSLLFTLFAGYFIYASKSFISRIKSSGELKNFAPVNEYVEFRILSATYGSPDRKINITDQLNRLILGSKLTIQASNNIAGDPHPGMVKKLKIKYIHNSAELEREYTEGDQINLP